MVYEDYYRRVLARCVPGPILELGGGSGNFKSFAPEAVATDLIVAPWLDVVADAQALPFAAASFANLVMIDVLHHVESVRRFLTEAERVLRPGGRLIFVEPAITPLSWIFWKLFHPEPVDLGEDPLRHREPDPARRPWDSNQAIPTLLVGRHRSALEREFPALRLRHVELLSFVAYPLSGGFRPWSLLPASWTPALLRLEGRLAPVLGRLAAFRLLAALERR